MKFLNALERRFGKYAIENVTPYLLVAQGCTFFLNRVRHDIVAGMMLDHDRLMAGEWWRIFSFMLTPPTLWPVFLIVFLSFYYFVGQVLETQWGAFRYNIYLLTAYLGTLLAVLIPDAHITNFFVMESVVLAFAWLFPDVTLLIFFVIPCRAKWIGLAGWIHYLFSFLTGGWDTKASVVAGALNFVLFFHADLWQWMKTSKRKFKGDIARARARGEMELPMHVCATCGVTDKSDRKMEFRYCPQCTGTPAYCINHIQNHQHR